MNSSYYAKLTNIKNLYTYYSDYVRWLEPVFDYDLIKEYFKHFNVYNDLDTYFGINLKNLVPDYSMDENRKGRLCGFIIDNKIMSLAGVKFCSPSEWEICAVSSLAHYYNRGYSKVVCSFAAKYILGENKKVICETNITNLAMQTVLSRIGMTQYFID